MKLGFQMRLEGRQHSRERESEKSSTPISLNKYTQKILITLVDDVCLVLC